LSTTQTPPAFINDVLSGNILIDTPQVATDRPVRPLLPLRPMFAPASFGGMHRLAAKLLHEEIRVFLLGKTENTVPFPLPNNGTAVP
jgi:hypothetical protein